jgi:hypothetical protein
MATYTTKQLAAVTQLTTSAATLYTVPTSTTTTVKTVAIANVTAVDANVTFYLVPSAGTAGATNAILSGVNIPANTTTIIDTAWVIPASAFIQAKASTGSALNVHISGIEIA